MVTTLETFQALTLLDEETTSEDVWAAEDLATEVASVMEEDEVEEDFKDDQMEDETLEEV